jgi:hypothetical protein
MFLFKKKSNKKEKESDRKSSSQNPKILEVNLIKDEAIISFDWNKHIFILAATLFLAGLLVAEIYFSLGRWEEQEISKAQTVSQEISKINQEASKLKAQAAPGLAYKEKAATFTGLLKNHIYWSNFFNWLEKNTLSSVRYGDFSGDLTGLYAFAAKTKTLADVSWQVKAFLNDPLTQKALVGSVDYSKGKDKTKASEVDFNLELQVNPEIFKK